MSSIIPGRPTRRAASRKKPTVESDSDEKQEESTPPAQTPRRSTRASRASPIEPANEAMSSPAPAPVRNTRKRRTTAEPDSSDTGTSARPPARKPRGKRVAAQSIKAEPRIEEEIQLGTPGQTPSVSGTPKPSTREATPSDETPRARRTGFDQPVGTPPSQGKLLRFSDDAGYTPDRSLESPGGRKILEFREGAGSTPERRPRKVQRTSHSPAPGPSRRSSRAPTLDPDMVPPTSGQRQPSEPPMSQQSQASTPKQAPTQTRATPPPSQIVPQSSAPAEPKSRMVIVHLVLVNFKSYAGTQEVGPFHPSFSSVVGPNGSGKSNVIDSLLFVFGFRASKMRQGKISALIHNSAGFPDLSYCEVEVHFQEVMDLPNGAHTVVPNSLLKISRKAFKNNSSKYTINGRESSFTQVTGLLRERGVDLDHKRFLILQGEVESIAQMKPKAQGDNDDGLLEYLEDIIGTSKYKQPIQESAQQLEELNEVCVEKSARVQHVEKEKNNLEDQKNAALAFIKQENELAAKHATLYQIHIQDCNDNVQATQDLITQVQAELDAELEKHSANEQGSKDLEKKYKRGVKEVEEIEGEAARIAKDMAKFDKENVKLQEKKKFIVNKEKKLNKALQTNRVLFNEADELIRRSGADTERITGEVSALEERLKVEERELAKVRDELTDKTQVFSEQIAAKQKQLEPWIEKINQKQSSIAVAQSELDILNEKRNAGQVEHDEIQARIATITESRATKEAELKDCKKEKVQVEKELQKVEAEVAKMQSKEPALRDALSSARGKADEAKASLSNFQTQGNVLTGLMRLQETGRIDGFYGRLGNLGAIEGKYDVAISTACPQLDNMVVSSVETAQQCIEYLRKNNLGRANFICLDKLPNRDLGRIQTPEDVPRLFDLITPKDQKFIPAFYSVLQDTLVARDLPQANRVAYGAKRYKVVTLDGKLIEKSGAMTGGGSRVYRGKMSSKIIAETTKEAVAKLELDREAREKEYQDFQTRLRELQQRQRELSDRLPELDVMMSKIALEIQSGMKHLADAEKRIKELSSHRPSTTDDGKIAKIEKTIAGLEDEVENLKGETVGIEAEIRSLQDRIMQIGGVKLRSQGAKVDGLREQIELLNQQHMQAEVAMTKAQKNKEKSEKTMTEATADVETLQIELQELEKEISDAAQEANQVRANLEEASDLLETKREELATIKAELDEKQAELNKARAVEIELKNKLESNQKNLSENQKRARYWHEKLQKLTLHNLNDLGGEEGDAELPSFSEDELRGMEKDQLNTEIAVLEEKTQSANVDLSVLQEYRKRVEEHTARNNDLQAVISNRDEIKSRCDDFRKRRLDEFMVGFNIISLRLKEMYQMITMGGNAELELVDSLDPFAEGILFSVMPPKKSWKNISNLSGGEKTLSSLALVFALHHYKPTPLYVMDEIDAALDFRNVSIVASYIKERTKNAQFIVISLRNNMFEMASRLVGVYKVNHMTKSITIENKDYLVKGGQQQTQRVQG